MARARGKKSNFIKKLVTVGGILGAVQLGFIFFYDKTGQAKDIKIAIDESLNKQAGLTPKAKEQLRIQLAVTHFQTENGRVPGSLSELVPTYFDAVPTDPDTQKPYAYAVQNGRTYIGDRAPAGGTVLAKADGHSAIGEEERTLKEQEALIASLDDSVTLVSYVYDPTGKRDPFRPYDATPKINTPGGGLTGYDIGQLRLTAVVDNIVTIEDGSGKGYIARKGTKIGLNNGEIVEILSDRIKILEIMTDFTGKQSQKVIEMQLRGPQSKPQT